MELKFDKNRKRVKKCPCCGHENKGGFVPYIGTDNGYCHYCGSSCFNEENGTLVSHDQLMKYSPRKQTDYLPEYFIEQSFSDHENIDFVKFLLKIFNEKIVIDIVQKYKLCGSTKNPGAVIFWQIDKAKKIRTGKLMEYDPVTGKRSGYINWVHSFNEDYGLKQCFFGEHLITREKVIGIVESEKTACIMSYILPNRTWIASGGSNGLTKEKCSALKGYEVVLFPDHGKYKEWSDKALEIGLNCQISIDCEEWFEKELIKKGEDIADYYLRNHDLKPQKKSSEWNQEEYDKIKNT